MLRTGGIIYRHSYHLIKQNACHFFDVHMARRDGLRHKRDPNVTSDPTFTSPSSRTSSAAKQPTGMAAQFSHVQSFAELTSVVNDLTSHLQLSFHGHVVPLPSSRTVGVSLCALAIARILPAVLGTLPHCTLSSYIVLIAMYVALEVGFFFYQWRRTARTQNPLTRPATLPNDLPAWYMQHLEAMPAIPLDELVRGWFFNAPLPNICRTNVLEYFSYIFAMDTYSSLAADVQVEIDRVVDAFEQRIGRRFADGTSLCSLSSTSSSSSHCNVVIITIVTRRQHLQT